MKSGVISKTGPPSVTPASTITDGLGFVYSPNGKHLAVKCINEVQIFARCVGKNSQLTLSDDTATTLSVLDMNNVSHLTFSPKGSKS